MKVSQLYFVKLLLLGYRQFSLFWWNARIFRDDYELSFEQYNYDDLKDKLLKTQNQKLLKNLGDIVNKDINNILSEKILLDKFSAAFNNE